MKLSKFYFKIYLKNIIFVFILFSVCFFTLHNRGILDISVIDFTVGSTYALFCTTVGIMMLSTFISGKNYEIINTMETNKYKAYLSNIIAGVKVITLLLLIPVVVILLYADIKNINYYQIKQILHFVIIWYMSNVFTLIIGATTGFFVKNFLRYIICILLFLPLTLGMQPLPSLTYRLLNIFEDRITSPVNYGSPVIFNLFYLLDKLFIIAIILFMLIIVYLKANKKSYNYYIFTISTFILIESLIIYGSSVSRYTIGKIDYVENIESENSNTNYYIKSYNMNIDLKNKINNRCSIELIGELIEINKLEFFLSEIFEIEKILINGQDSDYLRDEDKIIIEKLDIEDEDLVVDIYYSGRVYIENSLGTNICYVSKNDISLMDNIFYWYPVLDNRGEFYNFNIVVNSKSRIYSNLPVLMMEKKEGKSYITILKGKSKGINIFYGDFAEIRYKNINVVYPKGIGQQKIEPFIEGELDSDVLSKIDISKLKQIIIVPYDNTSIRIYEDTVIIPSRFV